MSRKKLRVSYCTRNVRWFSRAIEQPFLPEARMAHGHPPRSAVLLEPLLAMCRYFNTDWRAEAVDLVGETTMYCPGVLVAGDDLVALDFAVPGADLLVVDAARRSWELGHAWLTRVSPMASSAGRRGRVHLRVLFHLISKRCSGGRLVRAEAEPLRTRKRERATVEVRGSGGEESVKE